MTSTRLNSFLHLKQMPKDGRSLMAMIVVALFFNYQMFNRHIIIKRREIRIPGAEFRIQKFFSDTGIIVFTLNTSYYPSIMGSRAFSLVIKQSK